MKYVVLGVVWVSIYSAALFGSMYWLYGDLSRPVTDNPWAPLLVVGLFPVSFILAGFLVNRRELLRLLRNMR